MTANHALVSANREQRRTGVTAQGHDETTAKVWFDLTNIRNIANFVKMGDR